MKGTIIAYEAARGVGLIAPEEGSEEGPAHLGFRIEDVELGKGVAVGKAVIFAVEVGDNYACRIRLAGGPGFNRSRLVAAFLAIFGGVIGLQKFYLGYTWTGVLIMVGTLIFWGLLFLPVIAAIGLGVIEGFIYLRLSNEAFEARYLKGRRRWL